MSLLFYSAGFDWRCNISPDVSLTHKLTSILLWWTNNKCLEIALAKCQCYHRHGIHQKTNVYMCNTSCKTHFKRWIWSGMVLLPRSSSSGLHMVLEWKTVNSGLVHLVPDQLKPCCQCWWNEHLPSLQSLKNRALVCPVGGEGQRCQAVLQGFFPPGTLPRWHIPSCSWRALGPSGSVAFFAAKGERLCQCRQESA